MLLGFFLMAAPFALGLSPAAGVLGVLVGTILVGLALSSAGDETDGHHLMPVSAHHALDHGLATGLLGAAVVIGLSGDRPGAVLFALAAIWQLVLLSTTRYSRR